MKKLLLVIPLLFLALVLTSCENPEGDLTKEILVVGKKIQDSDLKKRDAAKYIILRYSSNRSEWLGSMIFILPDTFAEVGQHIYATGTNIYAGPMEAEINKKKYE